MNLAIVSTRTKDVIFNRAGQITDILKGGPAYFIQKACDGKVPHKLITRGELEAQIIIEPGQRIRGRVKNSSGCQPIPNVSEPNLLVSTLHQEWDIESLVDYTGRLFLDIQGLVRNPLAGFGYKKMWDPAPIKDKIFCLKGTELELKYLPMDFIKEQRNKLLIITKGADGSEIYYKGNRFIIKPSEIIDCTDNLGAGDTFFANFIIAYIIGRNIVKAAQVASNEVIAFLKNRTNN